MLKSPVGFTWSLTLSLIIQNGLGKKTQNLVSWKHHELKVLAIEPGEGRTWPESSCGVLHAQELPGITQFKNKMMFMVHKTYS